MNIKDVIKELCENPSKVFYNGYNTIEMHDDCELKITDLDGTEIFLFMENYEIVTK